LDSALAEIAPADRLDYVVSAVREEAAAVLAMIPDEVDTRAGLFETGMDSLMSVELKRRLELRSSRSLPSTLTFDYPNVEALARYLYGLIAPAPAPQIEVNSVTDEREDLSEGDLAALLLEALKTHA
jgi:acyl carrier protein